MKQKPSPLKGKLVFEGEGGTKWKRKSDIRSARDWLKKEWCERCGVKTGLSHCPYFPCDELELIDEAFEDVMEK